MNDFSNANNLKLRIIFLIGFYCLNMGLNASFAQATKKAKSVQPKPGKWKAIVSNGYKGDVLIFTVKPGGKIVENVEFVGYWRSSGRTETLVNLDPPGTFPVTNGFLSEIKQVPDSRMWWEFMGRFKTATTAEGTYRATFAGGTSDTYKLKWEAKWTAGN